ncbi:MAG: hypothetical protein JWQ12_61 [Glaciihabitans sp.]|nr:hypothetical protein [Glaciihabitans sp.]
MRARTTRLAMLSALAVVSGLLVAPVLTAPAARASTVAQPASRLGSPAPGGSGLGDEIAVPGGMPDGRLHPGTSRSTAGTMATSPGDSDANGTVHMIYLSVADATTSSRDNYFTGFTASTARALVSEMNSYWHAESEGAVTLVFGGFETRSLAAPTCDANAVLSADSQVAFGGRFANYGWSGSNNHLIVVTREKCGGQAFATVGGGGGGTIFSSFGISRSAGLPFLLHEFGHNLGLRHADSSICKNTTTFDAPQAAFTLASTACPTAEYDDYLDIMGFSVTNATPHVSSPQLIQLGFLRDYAELTSRGGTTTIRLKPLGATSGTRALQITDPRSGDTYYIEYRAPVGADKSAAEFTGALRCNSAGGNYSSCEFDSNTTYGSIRVLRTIPYSAGGAGTTVLATGLTAKSSDKKKRHTHLASGNRFTAQDSGFTLTVNSLSPSRGASITVAFP